MVQVAAVQAYLRQLVAQAMYMDESEIREDELFSNFGLESVTLVKLIAKINANYGVSIKPMQMLEHQTLRDASKFLVGEIQMQQEKNREVAE